MDWHIKTVMQLFSQIPMILPALRILIRGSNAYKRRYLSNVYIRVIYQIRKQRYNYINLNERKASEKPLLF